jgi:hypothetical protein
LSVIEATTIDALSSIALLIAITLMYPTKRLIHVFLDNARYHHAVLVQEWLAKPGCRIKVHYIPSYFPHLDPIERLWGLMHRHVTHNRSHPSFNDFCRSVLHFLRVEVPKNWAVFSIRLPTIINPTDFRVLKAVRRSLARTMLELIATILLPNSVARAGTDQNRVGRLGQIL